MDRVELLGEDLAPALDPGPAGDDREELVKFASRLEEMVSDGEVMDQAAFDVGPILGGERSEGQDVVLAVAASPAPPWKW